jgi:aryl-alcohol dehydrogenase-like predicted oxidoreductase
MGVEAPVPGYATRRGTEEYVLRFGARCGAGHYSEFLNLHLKLSSLGLGTFPGAARDEVDEGYAAIVERAVLEGINVIDTAAHYRYGRSLRAVGEGLRRAFAAGVAREQVFLVSKGGFLAFEGGPPQDFEAWFESAIVGRGLGERRDLQGVHLLTPEHLAWQLDRSRERLGVATLDAFLVDQPEVHLAAIDKAELNRKLERAFVTLERAVAAGKIRCYGVSTFSAFRVETDHPLFQSLPSLLGLAEKAARAATGDPQARHHFRVIEVPFNQMMTEAFTRFSHATGQGNIASTLQAAHQLRVYVLASHTLGKGQLAQRCAESVYAALSQLDNHAQRAMQFNRSTPGIGTTLVGVSTPAHLEDLLAVARMPPMPREVYLRLYRRAE